MAKLISFIRPLDFTLPLVPVLLTIRCYPDIHMTGVATAYCLVIAGVWSGRAG